MPGSETVVGAALALFGGAFNPPHRTHRRIAEAALSSLPISELRVLPCRDHPIKRDREMAAARHRLAMCELCFKGIEGLQTSDLEFLREGPSYTVDSLRQVKRDNPGREIYWLIGSDNLQEIHLWHDFKEIFGLAKLAVFPRRAYPITTAALARTGLSESARADLLIHSLDMAPDAVSATSIRQQIREGKIPPELDPDVFAYLRQHKLYQC